MIAAKQGHETVVMLLLKNGAQNDEVTLNGETALSVAATHGHEAVVRLLLQTGS